MHVCEFTDRLDHRYSDEPVLPELAALPNSTYASELFRMIKLAPNLELLAICRRNILNLDSLAFPSSLRLQSLFLGGISISPHVLVSFVNQSVDMIQYIDIRLVKLESGTWQQVLLEFCELPHLFDIFVDECGYSLTGSSSHLAFPELPGLQHRQHIETMDRLDLRGLGKLQAKVVSNRFAGGLKPFPKTYFQYIYWEDED